MRDLLKQDRPLAPETVRLGISVLGGLFGLAAIIITLYGLFNLFGVGTFFIGLLQISGGLGLLLAIYLIVRLLSEAVMALHRLNDRLTIQADLLADRAPAQAARPAAKPRAAKTTTRKAPARAKPATSEPADKPKPSASEA